MLSQNDLQAIREMFAINNKVFSTILNFELAELKKDISEVKKDMTKLKHDTKQLKKGQQTLEEKIDKLDKHV